MACGETCGTDGEYTLESRGAREGSALTAYFVRGSFQECLRA
jgi:hypothetical protein